MFKTVYHKKIFVLTFFLTTYLVITSVFAVDYEAGFEWRKVTDYTNGTVKGSTVGNPNLDKAGNPAWSYEWFTTALEDFNTGNKMQWNGWRWAKNALNVSQWDQNTHLNASTDINALVRWINPTGESINVDLKGGISVNWFGSDGGPELIGYPVDVRLVVGLYDSSEGTTSFLVDNMYAAPSGVVTTCLPPAYGDCDHVWTPLNFSLQVDPGDSIFWTGIPQHDENSPLSVNRWITTNDQPLKITIATPAVVPEPISSILFIAGGATLGLRRMRRAKGRPRNVS